MVIIGKIKKQGVKYFLKLDFSNYTISYIFVFTYPKMKLYLKAIAKICRQIEISVYQVVEIIIEIRIKVTLKHNMFIIHPQ